MRAILIILIIAVVAIIVAVASGFLNIDQVRGAKVPSLSATGNSVTAAGGQAPAFDVETGSIKVGAQDANVQLPTLEVQPPQNGAAATTNNAL